jgi:hypothetical protein
MLQCSITERKERKMAAKGKSAEWGPTAACGSIAGLLGDLIRQGTEGFVATQKILLDLVAQQNALVLTMVRERMSFSLPEAKKLADFAEQGVKALTDVERQVLDLAAHENSIVAAGLKPGVVNTPLRGVAEVIHQGLDNFIKAQKEMLKIIESQAEGAINDLGEGKGFDTRRLGELARDGTRSFLESQKKFLDILEEQLTVKRVTRKKDSGQRVDPFEMAKQSVDALIDTQERLLDIASDQVKASVKFAHDIFTLNGHPTKVSDMVKKSVDSFVAAQKALMELASKPRKTVEEAMPAAAA